MTNKGGGRQFLEPLAAVGYKLEQAYVPAARKAVDSPREPAPEVDVGSETGTGNNAGTGLFLLQTEASPDKASRVGELHEKVVADVRARHEQLLAPIKARYQSRLEQAQEQLAFLQRSEVKRSRIEPLEQAVSDADRKLAALETRYRSERLDLQNQLAGKRRQAVELDDRENLIKASLARMDEREALTGEQLASIDERIARLESSQAQATREIRTSSDAMALLTVGTQVDRSRARADQLEEQLRVGLPERRDELQGKLQDNQRVQEKVADDIVALENQLTRLQQDYAREHANTEEALNAARTRLERGRADYDNEIAQRQRAVRNAGIPLQELVPTRALFVGDRGIRPVGPGGVVILALGIILGGMLGVFAAFIAEFAAAARRRHQDDSQGNDRALEWSQDQVA